MSGLIVDNFQSLANVPLLSDRFIRLVMTGIKYTFNFSLIWMGLGLFYNLWAYFPLLSFAHKTLIPD